ncbi:MAG: tyrosine-type recombinase/integrase [Candidatus Contendobacter sp.]
MRRRRFSTAAASAPGWTACDSIDLRHTAISWLAQAGIDPQMLMRIGGWSTLGMVQRYTHLNSRSFARGDGFTPAPHAKDR